MLQRVLYDAEMREAEPGRAPGCDLAQRPFPRFQVDVRRRGHRDDERGRLDADASRVSGIASAVGAQEGEVVRGVPRSRPRLEVENPVSDHLYRLFRNRRELAPEAVEVVPVEPSGASLEPTWIDEVRCTDLAHIDPQARVSAHQCAGSARMVEVDVREHEMAQVLERHPVGREALFERAETARRPAVHQRRLVAGQQVRRNDPGMPEVEEVDELEAAT
jgi:hypothetical protein